jgi:DNA invertase Pin-like site-specific DNA recombinase
MAKRTRAPRRATGIIRTSVKKDEQTSPTTQRNAIEAFCALNSLELTRIIEEVGRSGYKESRHTRQAPKEALLDIKTGASDVVVAWRIDRVARNARELLNLINAIEEAGGAFASVMEKQFDTSTAMGRAMVTIVAALAELESAIKSERTQEWQDYRRAQGATPTGPTPFGYRRVRKTLVVNEDEAAIVRTAAQMLIDGVTVKQVQKYMTETATSRDVSYSGAAQIMTGPTIAGLRKGDDGVFFKGQWAAILERDTWEQVRAIFSDPDRRREKGFNARRHLLGGLIVCGRDGCCGTFRSKIGPRQTLRYACRVCDLSISAPDIDGHVEDAVLGALDNQAVWRHLQRQGHQHVDTRLLEDALGDLARRRLLPPTDPDCLTLKEWELMSREIRAQMINAAAQPVELPVVADPVSEWPDLPIDAKRLIINAVISRIEVAPAVLGKGFDTDRITLTPSGNISQIAPLTA